MSTPNLIDLYRDLCSTDDNVRRKAEIMLALLSGLSVNAVRKLFHHDTRTLKRLYEAYMAKQPTDYYALRLNYRNGKLLGRPLRPTQLTELAAYQAGCTDAAVNKMIDAIIYTHANPEESGHQIAKLHGLCSKHLARRLRDYLDRGLITFERKKTGPKPRTPTEKASDTEHLIQIGMTIQSRQLAEGQSRYVTYQAIANEAGCSVTTVGLLLRHIVPLSFRRENHTTREKVETKAEACGFRILSLHHNASQGDKLTVQSKVELECRGCLAKKRAVMVNSLINDDVGCGFCTRARRHNRLNEKRSVSMVAHLLTQQLGKEIQFAEDMTPPFLCKLTGQHLRVDGWCDRYRIVVEYQGALHHRPVLMPGLNTWSQAQAKHEETLRHDDIKRAAFVQAGVTFVEVDEISGWSYKQVKVVLDAALQQAGFAASTAQQFQAAWDFTRARMARAGVLTDRQVMNAIERIEQGNATVQTEAKYFGVAVSTMYRYIRRVKKTMAND
ncbi:hypothetical protein [uncultured Oceanisphaera sp.]|uniref:hypothetical protein n=1 Tax=uncultured Oceanisphaera sp. TaxID=353858 RepID=UPI00261BCFF7|nr:hypothetical protein [uncultured Oceanisphaera sp.]